MTDCCSSSCTPHKPPRKHSCPQNGIQYAAVAAATIKHHIKAPWNWPEPQQAWYFCDDPDCPVVYFAEDNSVIEEAALRTEVGKKHQRADSLLCYCFGVTYAEAHANPPVRDYVKQETKAHTCACDKRNPSGRCCLADFPKI
ncbi:MAG: hypothetical protein KZQ58_09015 [gamma proteobacterium symbiont of Bathyaustriella thionipta]|nr:hypothetical protein [gamma proteobacterium symbiont of Bathyaustriella thionipta]